MTKQKPLFLYEEIMLLALRDEKGTVNTATSEYALAGAVLAELLLDGRIAIENTRKMLVDVKDASSTGDPVIDECLGKLREAKRRAPLRSWVARLARIKRFRHKAALQLCARGILRADERKILLIFSQKIYPEINPVPERKIIERLRQVVFSDQGRVDARTVVLISLAKSSDLLNKTFGRKEMKGRKKRIDGIIAGDLTGRATAEAIQAVQTAVLVATMVPAMVATTTASA
ncbi:MAG: GOLPH3/VPS74 family protein [Gemmatimonadales bacterium]